MKILYNSLVWLICIATVGCSGGSGETDGSVRTNSTELSARENAKKEYYQSAVINAAIAVRNVDPSVDYFTSIQYSRCIWDVLYELEPDIFIYMQDREKSAEQMDSIATLHTSEIKRKCDPIREKGPGGGPEPQE